MQVSGCVTIMDCVPSMRLKVLILLFTTGLHSRTYAVLERKIPVQRLRFICATMSPFTGKMYHLQLPVRALFGCLLKFVTKVNLKVCYGISADYREGSKGVAELLNRAAASVSRTFRTGLSSVLQMLHIRFIFLSCCLTSGLRFLCRLALIF